MDKLKFIIIYLLFLPTILFSKSYYSASLDQKNIAKTCDAVANWQIKNQHKVPHHPLDWTNASLYVGMLNWWKATGNQTCFHFVDDIGRKYNWNMHNQVYHADYICVGQAFIELYRHSGDKRMIQPAMERAYYIIGHPSSAPLQKSDQYGKIERWSWADALFMAPPVYASLYTITKEPVFLEFMDKEFKICVDSLFDKEDKLFYRDNMRIPIREPNGNKQFWGRGNGWVFAALPIIYDALPENCSSKDYYLNLFKQMAPSIKKTQRKSGDWGASLLDSEAYPMPENSVSAFFCYGLTWGINNGFLDYNTYFPVVEKAWTSLVSAIHKNGKLGYIQPIGGAPEATDYNTTEVYGVGAFLLAGSELYRLVSPMTNNNKNYTLPNKK